MTKYKLTRWGCGDICACSYFAIYKWNPDGHGVKYNSIGPHELVKGCYDKIFETSWDNDYERQDELKDEIRQESIKLGLPMDKVEEFCDDPWEDMEVEV